MGSEGKMLTYSFMGTVERKRNKNTRAFFSATPPTVINHSMSSTDHTTNSKSALRKRCFFGNSALEGSQKKINTDFTSVSHLVMRTSGSRRCVIVEKKKPTQITQSHQH